MGVHESAHTPFSVPSPTKCSHPTSPLPGSGFAGRLITLLTWRRGLCVGGRHSAPGTPSPLGSTGRPRVCSTSLGLCVLLLPRVGPRGQFTVAPRSCSPSSVHTAQHPGHSLRRTTTCRITVPSGHALSMPRGPTDRDWTGGGGELPPLPRLPLAARSRCELLRAGCVAPRGSQQRPGVRSHPRPSLGDPCLEGHPFSLPLLFWVLAVLYK